MLTPSSLQFRLSRQYDIVQFLHTICKPACLYMHKVLGFGLCVIVFGLKFELVRLLSVLYSCGSLGWRMSWTSCSAVCSILQLATVKAHIAYWCFYCFLSWPLIPSTSFFAVYRIFFGLAILLLQRILWYHSNCIDYFLNRPIRPKLHAELV